ncbi:MAG TPA: hypothetical protein VFX58_01190 [Chitinophagaceae bacterium]|nr:hypothetical protein [Chitinophagaceae bacterium]
MRKSRPFIWVLTGLAIGTTIGVIFQNIAAGMSLGTATGILTMLIAFTEVDQKNKK